MSPKSSMYILLPFLAFTVGMLLPFQAGINAQLRGLLGNPVQAALLSFTVGTFLLLLLTIALRLPMPSGKIFASIPWWIWLGGGFCGAIYITMVILLAPLLGAATTFGLIIAGQLIMALILDHYGAVGFAVHPVNIWRVIGVLFLIVGVILIRKF